jgi:class 3 adenylate cyclase
VTLRNSIGEKQYSKINAQFRQLFQRVIADFKGARIRQWMGDGCLTTFESVTTAVKTALLVQHGLTANPDEFKPIAVRFGIDSGEIAAMPKRNTQKYGLSGLTVDRTSRIVNLSTAGRQILVSSRAFDDGKQGLGDTLDLPGGGSLNLIWKNHGRYKLKGFSNPIEIYEVGAKEAGSHFEPPPGGSTAVEHPATDISFEKDIFVSYASDVDPAWAAQLSGGLKQSIVGRLNREISTWPGETIAPKSDADQARAQRIAAGSKTMVVICSAGYAGSQQCAQELSAFMAQKETVPAGERIVVVETVPGAGRESWPDALRRLRSHRFWTRTADANPKLVHANESPAIFYKKLDSLSIELSERLSRKSGTDQVDSRLAVFLAEVTESVAETRDDVRRYLVQMGFRVFPETRYEHAPEAFRTAMLRDLQRCRVFAQFLGDQTSAGEWDLPGDFIEYQNKIAREANVQTFRWRSREVKLAEIKDPAYKQILSAPDVRSQSLEDAKQEIERIANRSQTTHTDPFILLRASEEDQELALQILDRLHPIAGMHNVGYVADLYGEEDTLGAEKYGGLIVVYGKCKPQWVRDKLKEGKTLLASSLTAYGVCKGPPPPQLRPLLYVIPGMKDLATDSEQFNVELEKFVTTAAQLGASK